MRSTAPIASLFLVTLLGALPALADEPPAHPPDAAKAADGGKYVDPKTAAAEAKRAADAAKAAAERHAALVKQGTEQCNGGALEEGLVAFDAAWAQQPDADLAVLIAACDVKAKRWPEAAEHLAYALRIKRDPEVRRGLEPTFVDVRARVGAVKVKVNIEGADVFVQDRYAGTSPLAGEVYVAPGEARISAKKPGFGEVQKEVSVPASGTAEVALTLTDEAVSGRGSGLPARRSRTPAYVLGGLTLVTAGIGAALVAAGASKGSAADGLLGELQSGYGTSAPCPTNVGCSTLSDLRSGHDSLVNAGIGFFGVSGALLVTTVIYGLWASRAPDYNAGLRFAPVASSSGGGLTVKGAF